MVVFVICLLLFLLIGVPYILSFMARSQKDVLVQAPARDIAALIESKFGGRLWRGVRGEGQWNYECRGLGISSMAIKTKPVLSITLTDHGPAGVQVSIWMSEYGSSYGQVGCADRVIGKRAKFIRSLRRLAPAPAGAVGAPAAHGMPQQAPSPQSMPPRPMPNQPAPNQPMPGAAPTPTFGPGAGIPGGGAGRLQQPAHPGWHPPNGPGRG